MVFIGHISWKLACEFAESPSPSECSHWAVMDYPYMPELPHVAAVCWALVSHLRTPPAAWFTRGVPHVPSDVLVPAAVLLWGTLFP